jgi:hypothetical protein
MVQFSADFLRRDNPETFDPDRWDTEKVKNRGRTEYMP